MNRKKESDTTFNFRCLKADLKAFRKCAKDEGFSNVSSWILWHLRKIIRDVKDNSE